MAAELERDVTERAATTFRGRVLFIDPKNWGEVGLEELRQEQREWGDIEATKTGARFTADQQQALEHMGRPWEAPMETAMLFVQDLADAIAAKDPQSDLAYVEEQWPDDHIEQGFRLRGGGGLRREGLWIGNLSDGQRSFTVEYRENQVVRTIGNDGHLISSFGYRFTEQDHRLAQEDGYANAGIQMDAEVGDLYAAQRAAAGNSVQDWDIDFDREAFIGRQYQAEFGEPYDPTVATPEQRDRLDVIRAEINAQHPHALMDDAVRQVRPVHNPHETQTLAEQIRAIEHEVDEQREQGLVPPIQTPEEAAYEDVMRSSVFPSGYGQSADVVTDLYAALAEGAELALCRTPDSRLIRGIDLDRSDQPFDHAASASEAQQWDESARTNQFAVWQKPILAKIRASAPEFRRQLGTAIARQMADDWRDIGSQIAAVQDEQDKEWRYVELRHRDGSVERGLLHRCEDDVVRHGMWLARNADGTTRQRAYYQDGELDGHHFINGTDGHVMERETYCMGVLRERRTYEHGQWQEITEFDADGERINTLKRTDIEARRKRGPERQLGVRFNGR